MKKIYCDKCGKEIKGDGLEVMIEGRDKGARARIDKHWYDLCEDCSERLLKWLSTKVKGVEF